jgi:hypothetical protein
MMTGRGRNRAGAGGELGLGGRDLESKLFSTFSCMCVNLVRHYLAAVAIIFQRNTTQHRNLVSVTSISSVLTV